MTTHRRFIIGAVLLFCSILPLKAQVTVVGDLSHDIDVSPGGKYDGIIQLRNETNEPQEAKIYQTDYTFRFDGTNDYGEPGKLPRSNAKWINFSPSYVIIPPQGSTTIGFTVTVPYDTAVGVKPFIGTYWSMLMVEGISKGSKESSIPTDTKKPQMAISQTIRYGIQVATHFANTGVKKIEFLDTKIVEERPGERILQVDIANIGDIGFRPDVYVELFDSKGASMGKFTGIAYRIYPGTSARERIDLSKVPSGTYKAMVVIDAGGEDIFGAQHTLKF
jgi:hypothetical protein